MKTFCVLPWVGREIGWHQFETHCCLLPKTYDITQIKASMIAGEKPTACQKCWNLEDQGLKSDRQLKNSALDFYWNRDLQQIHQDAINGKLTEVLMLKLITSNTCNATCISCNAYSSSSWHNLDPKIKPITLITPNKSADIDRVKQRVNFKELKMLSLIGGEPLYEKKNFELLEYMLELGNDTVFLSIVTNGSVELSSKQKTILSKFKNLNFTVSIDGVGPVFEYLRYPLKWNKLLSNLEFFKEITKDISANYTLSNLNILSHNETKSWFDSENIPYANNPIYDPAWLQPRSLPVEIKSILKDKLSEQDYTTYIGNTHTNNDQENFEEFLIQINRQDQLKKIQMKDYLPELAKLISLV